MKIFQLRNFYNCLEYLLWSLEASCSFKICSCVHRTGRIIHDFLRSCLARYQCTEHWCLMLHSPGQSDGNIGGIYASQGLQVDIDLVVIYRAQPLLKHACPCWIQHSNAPRYMWKLSIIFLGIVHVRSSKQVGTQLIWHTIKESVIMILFYEYIFSLSSELMNLFLCKLRYRS